MVGQPCVQIVRIVHSSCDSTCRRTTDVAFNRQNHLLWPKPCLSKWVPFVHRLLRLGVQQAEMKKLEKEALAEMKALKAEAAAAEAAKKAAE